jgi:glucokinase
MKARKDREERLYLGVDVGGTKVQASVTKESGSLVERQKRPTPRTGGPEQVLAVIESVMEEALKKAKVEAADLSAVGIAVPGVVDPDTARVVVTPNMSLTGVAVGAHLEGCFRVPVAVGNDGNLGTLGESWLGSARKARSAVGIWIGTGIGAGFVQKGRLWRGARESAGEIGHIVMQIGGPVCGCGNQGCLEALASRSAIERDIRHALESGGSSVLTELAGGDLSVIRSGAIRKALKAEDRLVSDIVRHASEVLGHACLTVRHLVDPEVIVLGGGLIEACSDFMMPIVENIVGSDRLPGARSGGRVLLSALGDDAVVLGAVALARKLVGRSPFKKRFAVRPAYPELGRFNFGEIVVDLTAYGHDVYIPVNGKVKARDKSLAKKEHGDAHLIGPKELEQVCKGGPEVLFIGSGKQGKVELTEEARRYLSQRAIRCELFPTGRVVEAYNKSKERKAALIHVTC